MARRSEDDIIDSIQDNLRALSPQIRYDKAKGPFYYLAARAVAGPLSEQSGEIERVAQLSTFQFPLSATTQEALATARAFGLTLGTGGYARGLAYFITSRRPVGTTSFVVSEGDTVSTAASGGVSFEAVESRSLTDANADVFYNPSTRRYELPVQVQALAAGEGGNIAARTLNRISGGAVDFESVTNLTAFTGGSAPQSISTLYGRVQAQLPGLDTFSKGGLPQRLQNLEPDRISAIEMTYSNEYPNLFYRLPDGPAVDVWVLGSADPVQITESFTAMSGQTQFVLSRGPVVGLTTVLVNGASASATLVLDEGREYGRSTKESSYVSLAVAAAVNDIVDITYTYDSMMTRLQEEVDGYLNASSGALFATDVLVRYPRTLAVACQVTGSVLGTFDPTTVEEEVLAAVGDFMADGGTGVVGLGGSRSPGDLRDYIRSVVPGIASLTIPVFGREQYGIIVETIDIPRNAQAVFAATEDLVVRFT